VGFFVAHEHISYNRTMRTVGIDEVGRGCWAGPVVAGAVLLHQPVEGLRDSKVLTAKKRVELDVRIRANGEVGLGWVWPEEIHEIGLTEAVRLAMRRALAEITTQYDEVIIDGNSNYLPDVVGSRALIKADDLVPAVSAASIAAKVARDTYMQQIAAEYPAYGFEKHVGYGTAAHIAALELHGVTPLHRLTYKPIIRIMEQAA